MGNKPWYDPDEEDENVGFDYALEFIK